MAALLRSPTASQSSSSASSNWFRRLDRFHKFFALLLVCLALVINLHLFQLQDSTVKILYPFNSYHRLVQQLFDMDNFNPYEQNVTILASNGLPFNVSIPVIDEYVHDGIITAIGYGSQIGASIVTLLILFLLTRADKRRTAVFGLNISSLLLNIARLVCQVLFFTSGFFEVYQFFSGDFSKVPKSDYATSVMAGVLLALLEICIEASLVLQTMVICSNMPDLQKRLIFGLSCLFAIIPVGFRMAQMIENSIFTIAGKNFLPFVWLEKANTILITISICFFSAVFVAKLGYTIHRRTRLGIRQFGPMQAIFIMGCQTMIIPAIFSILQFTTSIPEINSNVFTFVVISLPLSSIWATTALPGQAIASSNKDSQHLWAMLSFNASSIHSDRKSARLSPAVGSHTDHVKPLYSDLESGKNTIGVRHDFSVEH